MNLGVAMNAAGDIESHGPSKGHSMINADPIMKLAFDKVGLVGRQTELRILRNAIENPSTAMKLTSARNLRQPMCSNASKRRSASVSSSASSASTSSSTSSSSVPPEHQSSTPFRVSMTGSVENVKAIASIDVNAVESSNSTSNPTYEVIQSAMRTLVLVSGQSGSGKSALINHLKRAVSGRMPRALHLNQNSRPGTDSRANHDPSFPGFFALGKCELSNKLGGIPYSGLQMAMQRLCKQIAMLPEKQLHVHSSTTDPRTLSSLRSLLHKGLTMAEMQLLSNVMPTLASALRAKESQPEERQTKDVSSKSTHSCAPSVTSADSVSTLGVGMAMEYRKHTDRLKYVMRRFLQLLCSYCPVVIAVEDLQWADQASLNMIQSWLLDSGNTSLTIIGSYRCNMLDENPTLKATLELLEKSKRERSIRIVDLPVRDLDEDQVEEYLARVLTVSSVSTSSTPNLDDDDAAAHSMPKDQLRQLAKLVHARTGGNVFFMQQYLESLVKSNLIRYGRNSSSSSPPLWTCDLEKIGVDSATITADDIFALMRSKFQEATTAHRFLCVVACLGATFSFGNVCTVLKGLTIHSDHSRFFRRVFETKTFMSDPQIRSMLDECCREGLIQKITNQPSQSESSSTHKDRRKSRRGSKTYGPSQKFVFTHDKVQEAALSMAPTPEDLSELKYRVGEVLLYGLNDDELETKIYVVVNLLNTRPDLMPNHHKMERRMKIAMLNYSAGLNAVKSSAFHLASVYFRAAIDLLPHEHWSNSLDQSIELYSSAAESCFVTSGFAQAQAYCEVVIKQKCPVIKKVKAYHVLADICLAEATKVKGGGTAVDIYVNLLSELGCNFPKSKAGRTWYTLRGLMGAKRMTRTLEARMQNDLPLSEDEHSMAVMKTLNKLGTATIMTEPDLVGLIVIKTLRRSISEGISANTAPALVFLSIIVGFVTGDFDGGQRCGEIGMSMLNATDNREFDSRTILNFYANTYHWKNPLENAIEPMMEAYRLGMACGDMEAAMWALGSFLGISFQTGKPLAKLDSEFMVYTNVMLDFQLSLQHKITCIIWQCVLNLRGSSRHTTKLIGEAYDINKDAYPDDHELAPLTNTIQSAYTLYVASIFGDHEVGASIAVTSCLGWVKEITGGYSLPQFLFHAALCCFAMERTSKDRKYVSTARRCVKLLKTWAKKGCPNFPHNILLLEAEDKDLRKQRTKAASSYEESIKVAKDLKRLQDEAIANEKYAAFQRRRGNMDVANVYLEESIRLYRRWGASKKVEQLLSMVQ